MASPSSNESTSGESDSLALDYLGPIVINSDGSLSRIPNWNEFTESEKTNAIRMIAKRNKRRKEELLAARANASLNTVQFDESDENGEDKNIPLLRDA